MSPLGPGLSKRPLSDGRRWGTRDVRVTSTVKSAALDPCGMPSPLARLFGANSGDDSEDETADDPTDPSGGYAELAERDRY